MKKEDLKGKKVLVVGLGVSGYSAARLLTGNGAIVGVTDSSLPITDEVDRHAGELAETGVEVEKGGHTKTFFIGADLVVVSPGVDIHSETFKTLLPPGVPVIGELELGYIFCPSSNIIAVTGTNGKSTTVELLGHIFREAGKAVEVCGNIGVPFTSVVGRMTPETIAVIEVSSFQLETIETFRPKIAVLLNVTDDHFDRHKDLDEYKKEKFKVFSNQTAEDHAFLFASFRSDPLISGVAAEKVFFGEEYDPKVGARRAVPLQIDSEIPIKGKHNLHNIECAFMVAKKMGVPDEKMLEALKSFRGLRHRFEKLGVFSGIEYIDDSKATNIDATKCALESIDEKVVLVAGGIDKGGDYRQILSLVKDKVKAIVVIGEAKDIIKEAFDGVVPVENKNGMVEAVKTAAMKASHGDVVLLSPMCSSFDMFKNYKERGDRFCEAVKEYYGVLRN